MSSTELLVAILQLLLVTGIAFVVLSLITSFLRFQHMAVRARPREGEVAEGIEAFQVQIASRIGTAHRDLAPFSILVVGLQREEEILGDLSDDQKSALNEGMINRIRSVVRAGDSMVKLGDARFGIVADTGAPAGRTIGNRILSGVSGQPYSLSDSGESTFAGFVTLVVGPDCGERVEDLIRAVDRVVERVASEPSADGFWEAEGLNVEDEAGPVATPEDPLAAIPEGQRSLIDPATGVLKPEHLGSVMQKRFAQDRKTERPLSVACIQIDRLDRYLDHYGAAAEKEILGHLGAYLQNGIRENDLLGMLDDKRIVLLMDCAPGPALVALQRLADEFAGHDIAIGDSTLKVTLSCGVAGYPDHGALAKRLLEHAQTAQEGACARGRGHSMMYDSKMDAPKQVLRPQDEF